MTNNYLENPYTSLKTLSLFAISGLAIVALCELSAVFLGLGQILSPEMTLDLDDGSQSSLWLVLQSLVLLTRIPFYIFTVIFFLIWLNRAHKNLGALQATHTEFTSGWAVGWWFVPFANLVKPFQVVREVWWESNPEFDDGPTFLTASLHAAPTFMTLWWAFWIISNIASNITSRVFDPEDMSTVAISGFLFIGSGTLTVIAAVFAIQVVRDITQRQEYRFLKIGTMPHSTPPPPPTFGEGI